MKRQSSVPRGFLVPQEAFAPAPVRDLKLPLQLLVVEVCNGLDPNSALATTSRAPNMHSCDSRFCWRLETCLQLNRICKPCKPVRIRCCQMSGVDSKTKVTSSEQNQLEGPRVFLLGSLGEVHWP